MSQRETARGPHSRHSSDSPFVLPHPKPEPDDTAGNGPGTNEIETAAASTTDHGNVHQATQKPLGMTSILNPPEQGQSDIPRSNPSPLPQTGATALHPQSWSHTTGSSGINFQTSSSAAHHLGAQSTQTSGSGGGTAPGQRSSLPAHYPFPNISEHDALRTTHTSPQPRAMRGPRRDSEPHYRPYRPSPSPAKREYEGETGVEPRWLPQPRHSMAVSTVSTAPLTPPARSMSQPTSLQGSDAQPQHAAEPSTGWLPRGPLDQQYQTQATQFQPTIAEASAAAAGPGRPSVSPSPWADAMRRASMAAGGSGGIEGQQAFMSLPGTDIQIPVQVDYSQASKKADEKRQRNAKASTRHRRKKKTLQEENVRQLQEMKDERQQLAEELDHMRRQRDFYRDERDRLREIVSRTPGIQQHAAGPPSPTPTRSTGSHSDRSPPMHGPVRTSIQFYAGEAASADRTRSLRQALEDRQDYIGQPALGRTLQPSGLAMPPVQAYGHPHHPPPGLPPPPTSFPHPQTNPHYSQSGPSSGVPGRLPSLTRPAEGPPSQQTVFTSHEQERGPPTGQWRQDQSPQVESGWAAGNRPPTDRQPRQW